jgi:hypothetical protein
VNSHRLEHLFVDQRHLEAILSKHPAFLAIADTSLASFARQIIALLKGLAVSDRHQEPIHPSINRLTTSGTSVVMIAIPVAIASRVLRGTPLERKAT